jgi:gliding motility-associated-like protein
MVFFRLLKIVFTIICSLFCTLLNAQDFSANATSGCAPLHVKFSTSDDGTYAWTFGKPNNNTSNLQEPEVTYDEPGIYTITLSVNGGTAVTKTAYIKVYSLPIPDFTFSYNPGCAPLTAQFTNNSTSATEVPITRYDWIFGDGTDYVTSSASNVSHIYNLSGSHSITLLAANDNLAGCVNTKVVPNAQGIKVYDIQAKFSAPSFFCEAPATVPFSNASTGPGQLTYLWDFGGIGSSTQVSPNFLFSQVGSYGVKLTVKGDYSCTSTTSQLVNIGTSAFEILSTDKICEGQEVQFSVKNGEYLNSWTWNFGNGVVASSALEQKIKYVNPGTYDVHLNASIGNCSISLSKKIEVLRFPVAKFSHIAKCNRVINFINTSTDATAWEWDFGDGTTSQLKNPDHTFATARDYPIKLKVVNSIGCMHEIVPTTIHVYDNPIADLLPNEDIDCYHPTLQGCAPFTINFKNNTGTGLPLSSIKWDFGDGRISTLTDPTILYSTPGNFTVKLTVNAEGGCSNTKQVQVHIINPAVAAIPDISVSQNQICVGQEITIKANPPSQYVLCWEPEMEKLLTGNEFKYKYSTTGDQDIKLRIPGCPGEKIFMKAITVKDPKPDFTFLKHCRNPKDPGGPSPYEVDFQNFSTDKPNLIYEWNFGDGTIFTNRNPPRHTFPVKPLESIGYPVVLKVKDPSTQCEVSLTKQIRIQELLADFNVRGIEADNTDPLKAIKACKNDEIAFTDKSLFASKWLWDFNDLIVPANRFSTEQNPKKTYTSPGTYQVTLSIWDESCTTTKMMAIPITVPDLGGDFDFVGTGSCAELEVQFQDKSVSIPAANKWSWDFGTGDFSNSQNPKYTYKTPGHYDVSLTVGNDDGECTVPLEDGISFTNPKIDFSINRSGACIGETLSIAETTQFTNSVRWDFGNGKTSNLFHPTVFYDQVGSYPVTVWAKDFFGCEVQLKKENFVNITKPIADFQYDKIIKDCPPLIVSFLDKSEGVSKWLWNFGDDQQGDNKNPVHTYSYPGIYTVSLHALDVNGCADKKTISDLVKVEGPTGVFKNLNLINCTDQPILFSSTYSDAVSVQWDFGDGQIEQNKNSIVSHAYSISGKVQPLVLLKDEKGCEVVYRTTAQMTVHQSPEPDFNYSPEFAFEGEPVLFTLPSADFTFSGIFGDALFTDADSVATVFEESGTKDVILEIKDPSSGCVTKAMKEIYIQGYPDFLPNVFTPNEDGWNQAFRIPGLEKSSWRLTIYNRWGTEVYKNEDYENEWTGGDLSTGTYYYRLQNNLRTEKNFEGYIQILR